MWYRSYNGDLYLLRNILPDNTTEPDVRNFIKSGWKNQNEFLNIIDFGISNVLSGKMQLKIESHQEDKQKHPLGKVSLDTS